LTYALTSNATGSEKLKPMIIGKAFKPQAFQNRTGKLLGFYHRNNAKAWMTSSLYQEWLQQWDQELCAENRKVLLLQDNFSGHIVPDGLQNIRVENFQANLTAHVQPMDQGIIRCFKARYRTKFIQHAIDNYDRGTTPSKIYDIDQLQGMRLADAAWREVDTTTIKHCWRKASILPDTNSSALAQPTMPISSLLNTDHTRASQGDPISNAEQRVESALDELELTGALQRANRMDINTLLNPANESQLLDDTSDQEICKAVQDSRKEAEAPSDSDFDDDTPVNARPTRRELLQSVSVINSYVSTLDSAFARKVEAVLGSLGRQMRLEEARSMTSTHINDYFT
jgi:DDE superfamily endonuclease